MKIGAMISKLFYMWHISHAVLYHNTAGHETLAEIIFSGFAIFVFFFPQDWWIIIWPTDLNQVDASYFQIP